MGQRHSDAIVIALGAVNPTAIVHALQRASDEIRNLPEFAGNASISSLARRRARPALHWARSPADPAQQERGDILDQIWSTVP